MTDSIGNVGIVSSSGRSGEVQVRTLDAVKSFVSALDVGVPYTAGDLLWDSAPIADAVPENGGCGLLQSILLRDIDGRGPTLTLYVTNAQVDFGTLNAAVALSAGDSEAVVAIIDVLAANWKTLNGVKLQQVEFTPRLIQAAGNTRNFWIAAVVGGAATYVSAAGITGKIGIMPA